MASLTETAYLTRRAIRYGGLGFVALTVLWFVGVGFVNWWKATHPEPLPPPAAEFSLLPAVKFPKSITGELEFALETPTGKVGAFPDRLEVFFAPSKRSSFGDADAAIDLARRLNFLSGPTKLTASKYRWTNNDLLPGSLEVDVVSGYFEMKRQWQADPTLLTSKRYFRDDQAVNDARTFLRSRGILPEDMVGKERVSYWRVQGDQLIAAIALSEAEFVRVDFYRKPHELIDAQKKVVASYDFYTSDPSKGLISVLLSGSEEERKRVIETSYRYIEIDYTAKSEYPLKTAELALEELKNDRGVVVAFAGSAQGTIRRVALGYFDSGADQSYSMPVFVFTGDDGLVAYVGAVAEELIQKAE